MDRRFMFVDQNGKFCTQRQLPKLSFLEAILDAEVLCLRLGDVQVALPLSTFDVPVNVSVWQDIVPGLASRDDISAITGQLSADLRLVYMPATTFRQVDRTFFSADQRVSFADGFPVLLTHTASLADLNTRLEQPVGMRRFRPNIVITGPEAFVEDSWKKVRIGEMEFAVVKPCSRCVMTTIDEEGKKGKEPLRTLATYRRNEFGVCFGQNLVPLSQGTIQVGDPVEVLA